MTKEEYEKISKEISEKMVALNEYREKIKHDYIVSNAPFKIGDKIIVNKGAKHEKICFVIGFKIDSWKNRIVPNCVKCKKDRTPSKIKLHVWSHDELCKYD